MADLEKLRRNLQQILALNKVGEECGELTTAANKYATYGPTAIDKSTGVEYDNRADLIKEYTDITAALLLSIGGGDAVTRRGAVANLIDWDRLAKKLVVIGSQILAQTHELLSPEEE